jgi:hypothetical protein
MEDTVDAMPRSNRVNNLATMFAFADSESVDCVTAEPALSDQRIYFTDVHIA